MHAERCRENRVTGRGVVRLTREIEIIEQSRRLDDIYSHEFREEVVAKVDFPIAISRFIFAIIRYRSPEFVCLMFEDVRFVFLPHSWIDLFIIIAL